jgi:hypothetical protein
LQSQVNADPHLGAGYALAGQLTLNLTTVQVISDQQDKLTFQAGGLWAYQFTPAVLRGFASLIAGKSQSAARTLLLRQPGVSGVQFSNSGTLPVNTGEIQVSAQTRTS